MHCPFCRHPDSQVIDSRKLMKARLRRRRSCPNGRRFTTVRPRCWPVVKREDGVTEPFSGER